MAGKKTHPSRKTSKSTTSSSRAKKPAAHENIHEEPVEEYLATYTTTDPPCDLWADLPDLEYVLNPPTFKPPTDADPISQVSATPSYAIRNVNESLKDWCCFFSEDKLRLPDIHLIIFRVKLEILDKIPLDHGLHQDPYYAMLVMNINRMENVLEAKVRTCQGTFSRESVPKSVYHQLKRLECEIGGEWLPAHASRKGTRYAPLALVANPELDYVDLKRIDEFIAATDILYTLTVSSGLLDIMGSYGRPRTPIFSIDGVVLETHFFDSAGPKETVNFGSSLFINSIKHINKYIHTVFELPPHRKVITVWDISRTQTTPGSPIHPGQMELLGTMAYLATLGVHRALEIFSEAGLVHNWARLSLVGPGGRNHTFQLQKGEPLGVKEAELLLHLFDAQTVKEDALVNHYGMNPSAIFHLLLRYDRLWRDYGHVIIKHLLGGDNSVDPFRHSDVRRAQMLGEKEPSARESDPGERCLWEGCDDIVKTGTLGQHFMSKHVHVHQPDMYRCLWNGCGGGKLFQFDGSENLWKHFSQHHVNTNTPSVNRSTTRRSALQIETYLEEPRPSRNGKAPVKGGPNPNNSDIIAGNVLAGDYGATEDCSHCHEPPIYNLEKDSRVAPIHGEQWYADMPPFFTMGETPCAAQLESDRLDEDLARGAREMTGLPEPEEQRPGLLSRAANVLGLGGNAESEKVPHAREIHSAQWKLPKADAVLFEKVHRQARKARRGSRDTSNDMLANVIKKRQQQLREAEMAKKRRKVG
ncbi:hypothetical protein EJ08DRAFT_699548 [Tothia fuscella]|uniref:C2H2-type domain-containing protein n=1 Tax=Tothia fuscella TaxID=1048955 RepID=A0A9P4TWT6_9PEZI|nr:hypothetical protein EJ08DRAFT_699548 [Tothia fuscella]